MSCGFWFWAVWQVGWSRFREKGEVSSVSRKSLEKEREDGHFLEGQSEIPWCEESKGE